MSKYSHYEMCEKIFGQRYKWNEQKQDYELYSRTDMWNKLIEQQDKIADLEAKLAEKETRIAELEDKDWYEATIKQLEKQNERLIKERDGNYENYSICWKENEQLKYDYAVLKETLEDYGKGIIHDVCIRTETDIYQENQQLKQQLTQYEKFMKDNGFKDLEELDNYIQNIHSHYDEIKNKGTCGLCEKLDNELINQLKQQLADKEKEIESLKASSDKNIDYLIEFASLIDNEKDCNRMLKALDRVKKGKKYIIDKDNQDKISFAVEQLEKAKELGVKDFNLDKGNLALARLIDKIDDQIKAIKEMK